jgi:hypothetical protein
LTVGVVELALRLYHKQREGDEDQIEGKIERRWWNCVMEESISWIDPVNNEFRRNVRDEPEKTEPEGIMNSPGKSAMLKHLRI